MHLTREQRISAAHRSWEMAVAAQEKLGRQMDRLYRKEPSIGGVDYVVHCDEIELIRVQYEAVSVLRDRLWTEFETTQETT